MDVSEVPAMLGAIRSRVAKAAEPCAMAMGEVHRKELVDVTLVISGAHGPATPDGYPPAAPRGAPPMTMTGRLRGSVTCVAGPGGGGIGTSFVGPHTIYAATQEWGGVHTGDMWLWVHYVGPEAVERLHWRKEAVKIGPHPYMRPSRDAVIRLGWVTRAANAMFEAVVWG